MNYLGLAFALTIVASLFVKDLIILKKLERLEAGELKMAMKFLASPVTFLVCLVLAFGLVMGIPRIFGFEINSFALSIGIIIYCAIALRWSKPRWNHLKAKVVDDGMIQRGRGGERTADLRVRRISDYAPKWALFLPYFLLLIGMAAGSLLSPTPRLGETPIALPGIGTLDVVLLSLSLITTLFFTWIMTSQVKRPVDWRSDNPEAYAEKVYANFRRMIRSMLGVQVAYVLSAIFIFVSFRMSQLGNPGSSLSFDLAIASSVVFAFGAAWLSFTSRRTLARLEEERWESPLRSEASDGADG